MGLVGPVFVAGCPRSGTSALSWAIAAQPGYWTSAETHFFYYLLREGSPAFADAFALSDDRGSWLEKHGVAYDEFLQHVGSGLDRLMRSRSDGLQWIDGSPENVLVGRHLLTMFPDAQMFFLVRDPRAVCRSMLSSGFDTPWARDADEAIATWKHYAQVGTMLAAEQPDRVLQIHQEEMLREAPAVAAAVGARLRLTDAKPIETFLATRRVNSSYDETLKPGSRFREIDAAELSVEEFESRHGEKLRTEAGELAARLGYEFG